MQGQEHELAVKEKKELDEKLTKLRAFIAAPTFAKLDAQEQARAKRQEKAMNEYTEVLAERIAAKP